MQKIVVSLSFLLSASVSGLEISDFKSGHMCGINKDDMGWVCFESEDIYVTGQSSCQSQNEVMKCTWYGFSFEYSNAKIGQEITCRYTESQPVYEINLSSSSDEPRSTSSYTFTLDKSKGYFVNPQYSVLGTSGNKKELRLTTTAECFSEGKSVFNYKFTSVYPPSI